LNFEIGNLVVCKSEIGLHLKFEKKLLLRISSRVESDTPFGVIINILKAVDTISKDGSLNSSVDVVIHKQKAVNTRLCLKLSSLDQSIGCKLSELSAKIIDNIIDEHEHEPPLVRVELSVPNAQGSLVNYLERSIYSLLIIIHGILLARIILHVLIKYACKSLSCLRVVNMRPKLIGDTIYF